MFILTGHPDYEMNFCKIKLDKFWPDITTFIWMLADPYKEYGICKSCKFEYLNLFDIFVIIFVESLS